MKILLLLFAEIVLLAVCVSGSISGGYTSDSSDEVSYQQGRDKVLLQHRVNSIGATFKVFKPNKPFLKCTGNARGSAGACLPFPSNPNFAADMSDMPRYAACRLGCEESTSTCGDDTSTDFFACSSSYDLAFKCSSDSNRDELQQLIDALEDEGYFEDNCGFETAFDMQYLLGDYCLDLDTDGETVLYKLLGSDCGSEEGTFDSGDDIFFDFEHDSAFEAYLTAIAETVPSYSEYTDAKIGSCNANADPFISLGTSGNLYHCKISGTGIGGRYFFRFGDEGNRDEFCNAMTAIRDAKWLQVGSGCYEFPDASSVVEPPFIPPDCDSSAALVTPSVRASCKAHKDAGENIDGFYAIDPPKLDSGATGGPFAVYCDQTSDFNSSQVGGWTLFAYGNDNSTRVEKDVVSLCEYSVSTAAHWRALVLNMEKGMAFRDENDKLSYIQAFKIQNGNCASVQQQYSLMDNETVSINPKPRLSLWRQEDNGCSNGNLDYSLINVGDKCGSCASIYNQAKQKKFDVWPYVKEFSYQDQDELQYYIS